MVAIVTLLHNHNRKTLTRCYAISIIPVPSMVEILATTSLSRIAIAGVAFIYAHRVSTESPSTIVTSAGNEKYAATEIIKFYD